MCKKEKNTSHLDTAVRDDMLLSFALILGDMNKYESLYICIVQSPSSLLSNIACLISDDSCSIVYSY